MPIAYVISIISLCFGSGLLLPAFRYLNKRVKANDIKTEALCSGLQALLRDRMISMYDKYEEKGYAPIYAKDNFENMWKPYHELGVNGVMDDIREKFKNLPESK